MTCRDRRHNGMKRLLSALLLCAACATPADIDRAEEADGGGGLRIQVVRLEHARAAAVAEGLRAAPITQPASAAAFRVAVDPDQNAVVLSGSAEQIQEAMAIVARLDAQSGR